MRHAVIMAGGAGTRLWPLSRRMRPKQLMRLFDGASLLQIARRRLAGLFAPECTWVVTNDAYIDLVAAELPDLPRANLIGEPTGRDTANAIGLAAALIVRRDPDATIAIFTADHIIEPLDAFGAAIRAGLDAAEAHRDALVTFGVTPDSPHTGYGYLQKGAPCGTAVYRVREFREKPTRAVAERYLSSGEYLWNSGMFAWRAAAIRAELARLLPENFRTLDALAETCGDPGQAATRRERFADLPRISIDYGVMEKACTVLVVEMHCRWSDLGSWSSIAATQEPDAAGNVSVGAQLVAQESTGNIVVSEGGQLFVLLGVRDLVVIHSPDATLVCHRDHEQAIRELAQPRTARFGERYE